MKRSIPLILLTIFCSVLNADITKPFIGAWLLDIEASNTANGIKEAESEQKSVTIHLDFTDHDTLKLDLTELLGDITSNGKSVNRVEWKNDRVFLIPLNKDEFSETMVRFTRSETNKLRVELILGRETDKIIFIFSRPSEDIQSVVSTPFAALTA